MIVLALNSGSSSVKFQVVDTTADRALARGQVERIGGQSRVALSAEERPAYSGLEAIPDHTAAVRRVVEWLAAGPPRALALDAVGHRVVHGGARFVEPAIIDDQVMSAIEALDDLAPLHNAPGLAGIRACRALLGNSVPMVAVFDTAFHAGLAEHAYRYAIPYELSLRHGVRRFGFHGTSYRHVIARYHRLSGTPPDRGAIIALHLGNGCSIAAVKDGVPVDTSMGLTPLEGLVMGTRSGDLDPAIVTYLARKESVAAAEVERWLNERSGLLGVSGRSGDMRDLLERAPVDARARLAVDIFCYRARKYVGAYLAVLEGADAVLFTGGIGERSPEIRARVCAGMEWCGVRLDPARNAAAVGREASIDAEGARVRTFVIPTDEELVIARDSAERLGGHPRR